jgi:hypothetical protein
MQDKRLLGMGLRQHLYLIQMKNKIFFWKIKYYRYNFVSVLKKSFLSRKAEGNGPMTP